MCVFVYACMRARCFHARVWKKSGPVRGRTRWVGGREDVDIFLRATRECRERHAFDWPGVVGSDGARGAEGKQRGETRGEDERRGRELRGSGGGGGGWRGWSTLCRRFFGAFFYGRRPSLAWMNEHGEEHQ